MVLCDSYLFMLVHIGIKEGEKSSLCIDFVLPGERCSWDYLCDLLLALDHLHSQGFAHLDLKPANVFLTRSGRLKLGDFGLLLELPKESGGGERDPEKEKREKDDAQEGDPRYMAPELLRGEYGTAADVFRLVKSLSF